MGTAGDHSREHRIAISGMTKVRDEGLLGIAHVWWETAAGILRLLLASSVNGTKRTMTMAKWRSPKRIRDRFLAWQCFVRQAAMREEGGRPSPGMRPRVLDTAGRELAPALTVLLIPKEPEESTAFFRFQVMKTTDPRDLYERVLAYLQADYFQQPLAFGDRLTAVLPAASPLAGGLVAEGTCTLAFDQFGQVYRLPCTVTALPEGNPRREATLWHNRAFNPALPDEALVLEFRPDWTSAGTRD
jgi:hypothetical protein